MEDARGREQQAEQAAGPRRLILDILREQTKSQDRQFDSLRTAASILTAAGGIVLTQITGSDVQGANPLMAVLLMLGGVTAAVSVGAAVLVAWPVALWRNPKPRALVDYYRSKTLDELEEEMVLQWESSYTKSEPTLGKMSLRLKVSTSLLGIAVLAILGAALVKWSVQSLPDKADPRVGIETGTVPIDSAARTARLAGH